MEPQVITDQPGIEIIDKIITGGSGLKLVRCPGAHIENLVVSGSSFSGLWLDNCPGASVLGGVFHNNGRHKDGSPSGRVGHGIHLSGNNDGVIINGAECRDNFEDGAQQASNCTGKIIYKGVHFHHNMENGLDVKSGAVRLENPNMHDNGDGRGMEAVILQGSAGTFECYDGMLVVRPGENGANCVRTQNGAGAHIERTVLDASGGLSPPIGGKGNITVIDATLKAADRPLVKVNTPCDVLLDRCSLFKAGTRNWYKIDAVTYDMALDLDVPNLRVKDANI